MWGSNLASLCSFLLCGSGCNGRWGHSLRRAQVGAWRVAGVGCWRLPRFRRGACARVVAHTLAATLGKWGFEWGLLGEVLRVLREDSTLFTLGKLSGQLWSHKPRGPWHLPATPRHHGSTHPIGEAGGFPPNPTPLFPDTGPAPGSGSAHPHQSTGPGLCPAASAASPRPSAL